MSQQTSREYQTLLVAERFLANRIGSLPRIIKVGRIFSPWLLFWIIFGGFFFGFQSYLLLHALRSPLTNYAEVVALIFGIMLAVAIGLLVVSFFPNVHTDWRIPLAVFGLWMVGPTLFPLLFLIGVFSGQMDLIILQTASWRPIVEFLLFGLGLAVMVHFYSRITFTQGAVTILLFSMLFMGKAIASNIFYLTNQCPVEVQNEDLAWMSNTRAEIDAFRQNARDDVFYKSPLGQLICTRTHENLFR